MNPTIEKFGYPATLVQEFDHWLVLLRPAQVTLGSLVLAAKSDATAYSATSRPKPSPSRRDVDCSDRARAVRLHALTRRINYLMLMMVDPHVHFHVIPRYGQARQLGRNRISRTPAGRVRRSLGTAVALEARSNARAGARNWL